MAEDMRFIGVKDKAEKIADGSLRLLDLTREKKWKAAKVKVEEIRRLLNEYEVVVPK